MMGGNEGCGGGSFKREGIYVYLLLILLNCGVEKTLKSPLDCKEIQPVHSKGNQSLLFIGRTDAKAEIAVPWPLVVKNRFIGKDPDAGKD